MSSTIVQGLVEFNYSHQRGPINVVQHIHHFCQMDVILGGRMMLHADDQRIALTRGTVSLIPPLCRHGFKISTEVEHVTFKIHVHPQYSGVVGHRSRVIRLNDGELTMARTAGQWDATRRPLSRQGALAAGNYYLVHVLNHDPPPGAGDRVSFGASRQIWDVLSQVVARPHDGWTVRRLAEQCHVSEGHFTKTFVRSFAQTPQRFLLEARIWDAADRLSRDDQSIKSVAQETGYATVHSFTRAFKRAMGISPAAYVRSQGTL